MSVGRKVQTLFARDGKQLQLSLRSQRMSNTEFGRAIGRRPRISSGSGLAGVCAHFLHPHWQHNKLLLSAASDYDQDISSRLFLALVSASKAQTGQDLLTSLSEANEAAIPGTSGQLPSRFQGINIPGFRPLIRRFPCPQVGKPWPLRAQAHMRAPSKGLAGLHPK